MLRKPPPPVPYVQPYRYPSPNIPLSAIRRFARKIAERFRPERIILFGSYAYGTPHDESDVDLLVIMPAYDVVNQAIRICLAFDWPFSLDLIVRTPKQIERALRDDDWFLREVIEKGKVLYEAPDSSVGSQGRGGLGRGARAGRANAPAARPRVLPLSASRGEVPQVLAARTRHRRTKNPQSDGPP
jgi:predicted nucleotidyltransferase